MTPSPIGPGPDGGPRLPVKVYPEDFHRVALLFDDAPKRLNGVLTDLFGALSHHAGVAGVDDQALRFSDAYDAATTWLVEGFDRAEAVLADVAYGIDLSAENHWRADANATPGGGPEPLWIPIIPGPSLPTDLRAPLLHGNTTFPVPDFLRPHVPGGDPARLRDAGQAYFQAHDAVGDITTDLKNALGSLFTTSSSEDLDALAEFWNRLGGEQDSAILTALQRACQKLGSSLYDFAEWIDKAIDAIEDAILHVLEAAGIGLGIWATVTMLLDGLPMLLAPTLGAGAEGALVAAVTGALSGEVATVLAGVVGGASAIHGIMSVAIEATPNPNLGPTEPQHTTDTHVIDDAKQLSNHARGPGQDAQDIARHAMDRWNQPDGKDHFVYGIEQAESGLAKYVDDVMFGNINSEMKTGLSGGRTAYWDPERGAVVIEGPGGGTVFTPKNGKEFFDLLQ